MTPPPNLGPLTELLPREPLPAGLLALAVAGAVLLLSESVLSALGLSRARVGVVGWLAAMGACLAFWQWSPQWGLPGPVAWLVSMSAACLVTMLWFNDPRPVPPPRPASKHGSPPGAAQARGADPASSEELPPGPPPP